MRITKSEYNSLASYVRSHPAKFPLDLKFSIGGLNPKRANLDLQKMGADKLKRLIDALPHGRGTSITSPILTSIKKKARQSIAGIRMPHLDPDASVIAYRMMMRLNNSRAGIKGGPGGQFYKLNPKGMSLRLPLTGKITFDTRQAGDVHIMGAWSDVSAMLAKSSGVSFVSQFDDMYEGDVNYEFDAMYGSMPGDVSDWQERISGMPLCVTVNPGMLFAKTDDEGSVVLDPRGEIVNLVGSKITAIAGAAGPESLGHKALDTMSEIKGAIEDHVIPIGQEIHSAHKIHKEEKLNKTHCTVSIGVTPMGGNFRMADEELTGADVLRIATELRR